MDLEKLKKDTQVIIDDVIKQTEIKAGQVFVLGLSSSEVNGGLIGHASSSEIGQVIVSVIHKTLLTKEFIWRSKHVNILIVPYSLKRN